jgi:hypothetical protein
MPAAWWTLAGSRPAALLSPLGNSPPLALAHSLPASPVKQPTSSTLPRGPRRHVFDWSMDPRLFPTRHSLPPSSVICFPPRLPTHSPRPSLGNPHPQLCRAAPRRRTLIGRRNHHLSFDMLFPVVPFPPFPLIAFLSEYPHPLPSHAAPDATFSIGRRTLVRFRSAAPPSLPPR